ncbi:DUF4190 domain-containing protein [Streptomyces sp. NPDC001282]|uniref:DUF4190 domain-containing protein n=1 Tax=Streptomyces sp. NPDC001282 TaxID=3364557 RepID=UPI00368BA07F
MSDNTQQPADGAAPRDPWAPPDRSVPLDEPTGDPRKVPLDKPAGEPRPSAVHDQPTVTSMPGAEDGLAPAAPAPGPAAPPGSVPGGAAFGSGPGGAAFGAVPPPPIAPNGPGQQIPPAAGQYGYPAAPAPQYGYPGYTGYPQAAWGTPPPANGMGTAAMVLGILSLCLLCMWGIPGIVLGVLALIFGILGRKRAGRGEANNSGQALAGIIMGSVGLVLGAAFLTFMIWVVVAHPEEFEDGSTYEDPYATSLVVDVAR